MHYPSPYGFGPPFYPPPDPDYQKIHEKAAELTIKLIEREKRNKERDENRKRSIEKQERQEASLRRSRTLLFVEWYILGILSYPLWEPLYRAAIAYSKTVQ